MHHFIFSRGPIKLYPLPGTEEYVAKVARWLAGNLGTHRTGKISFGRSRKTKSRFG